jgi:phage shock protein A
MENLGKISEATDANITSRIQEIEETNSVVEDTIEDIDTTKKIQCIKNYYPKTYKKSRTQ